MISKQMLLRQSEIAKPRVTLPENPASHPPKLPLRSIQSAIHSYALPYKEGNVLGDLEGFFFGGGKGVAIYENSGFPVSKPGFRNLRDK